jgi:hypothetical protein
MSKKYKNNNYNNNSSLNLNIEELKGKKVTLNNDKNKYLVVYPGDMNFLVMLDDLIKFITSEYEKIRKTEDIETEDTYVERLNNVRELVLEIKNRFNKIFNDTTAYDRIFGNVADINLMLMVITRVFEYVTELREQENGITDKYTSKYTN